MRIVTTYDDLTPEVDHILRVDVTPDRPKRIRHKAVLANQLGITIDDPSHTEPNDPGEPSDDHDQSKGSSAKGSRTENTKGTLSGAGHLRLKQADGTGSLWLGQLGGDVTVIATDGPVMLVSPTELLATDHTITTHLSTEIPKALSTTTKAARVWNLQGIGQIAFATNGVPVALPVTDAQPLLIEANALLACTTTVTWEMTDDHNKQLGRRDTQAVATKGKPGTETERVWILATGNGTILVTNQTD